MRGQVEQAVRAQARQHGRSARADARADRGAGRGVREGHHPRGVYRPLHGYHASRMFQSLSDKLQATLGDLRSRGALSEDDIDRAMREIRLALLEADVNFRVVKTFVAAVRERSVGQEVLSSLTPGQQVVKIVDEELTELLGAAGTKLTFAAKPPTVILLCGLQGSGKTTAAGKLANLLAKQGLKPALVACDLQRPAAVEQLKTLGRQVDVPVFERGTGGDPGRGRALRRRGRDLAGPRRRDRRHRRPPARRQRADGRARARPQRRRSRRTCSWCSTR